MMASVLAPPIVLLFLFVLPTLTMKPGEAKKVVIHVPYKVQHHLHTHTNYKVITVPENKERKTEKIESIKEKEDVATEAKDMLSASLTNPYKIGEIPTIGTFQPKVRTFVNVHETSTFPILNYLGLDHLLGAKPHRHIQIIQSDPIVQHVLNNPTALTSFDKLKTDQGFQFGEGTSLASNFDLKSSPLQLKPVLSADSGLLYNDFSNHQKITTGDVNEAFQKIIEKHLYNDFPELKNGKHYLVPKATSPTLGSFDTKTSYIPEAFFSKPLQTETKTSYIPETFFSKPLQTETKTSFSPEAFFSKPLQTDTKTSYSPELYIGKSHHTEEKQSYTPEQYYEKSFQSETMKPEKEKAEFEHIGYLVVGEDSQKFITVDEKDKSPYDS